MTIKIGINGFGRIGRIFFRSAFQEKDFDFVAVNDITDAKTLAHLLKYDSIHGPLPAEVSVEGENIVVNGKKIKVLSIREPQNLPWRELGVELVVESTGLFRDRENASKHLRAGGSKVIITAPAKEPDITIVLGVNEMEYDPLKHHLISNASCTTNCLAPVAKVLDDEFDIESGWMTTIHAYTSDQRLIDAPHRDFRRARAACLSMVPTTTGAAIAVGLVLPKLQGKLDGVAIRVPTANVSLVDLVARVKKSCTAEEVNNAFTKAASQHLKDYLIVSDEPLVSVDYTGCPYSAVVDAPYTKVIGGNMVKVLAWYDNEWGYSCRVRDLIKFIYQ